MAGNSDETGRGGKTVARRKTRALLKRLNALLTDEADLPVEELERRAKAVSGVIKAQQMLIDLNAQEDRMKSDDERLDAAGEQRLRDQLLGRLAAFAADLEAKGVPRCPECGRLQPDRGGLDRLGQSGAAPAAG